MDRGFVHELNTGMQELLDLNKVDGAILIFDYQENKFYSNDFKQASIGSLPASTYKIPHTIIGIEAGALKDENSLFEWNGEPRRFSFWEQDLNLKRAFQTSCVPCYQDLAAKVGVSRMKNQLAILKFGEMNFDSSNLNNFWLQGSSKISLFEQITFLKSLYFEEFSINPNTYQVIKNILIIEHNSRYRLSGKTGWAVQGDSNQGWFVGYLERDEDVYFFASRIEPRAGFDMKNFSNIRKEVTLKAFRQLGFL